MVGLATVVDWYVGNRFIGGEASLERGYLWGLKSCAQGKLYEGGSEVGKNRATLSTLYTWWG